MSYYLLIYQQEDRCLEFHVEQIIISSGCAKLIIDLKSQSNSSSLDAVFCTFNQILGRGLQKVKPVTKTDLICSFDFLKGPPLYLIFSRKTRIIWICIVGLNSIENTMWFFLRWRSQLHEYFFSLFGIRFDHCEMVIKFSSSSWEHSRIVWSLMENMGCHEYENLMKWNAKNSISYRDSKIPALLLYFIRSLLSFSMLCFFFSSQFTVG